MNRSANRETSTTPAQRAGLSGASASKVTNAEWKALLASHRVAALNYDRWFKWRMLFLLAVALSYLLKLVFFRDIALANFDIPSDREHAVTTYLNWRIWSASFLVALYLFSYLKRWHFATISWIVVGVATTALVSDYFNVYLLTTATPPQWMSGLLALRFMAIACLLQNAINARRLPPIRPRRSDRHSLPRE